MCGSLEASSASSSRCSKRCFSIGGGRGELRAARGADSARGALASNGSGGTVPSPRSGAVGGGGGGTPGLRGGGGGAACVGGGGRGTGPRRAGVAGGAACAGGGGGIARAGAAAADAGSAAAAWRCIDAGASD